MIISALERIQQSSAEKIIIAVVNSFSLLLSIAPHFIKLYRAKGASDIYKIVCRCQSAMLPNQIFSFRVFLRFDCALISADHVSVCSFFIFSREAGEGEAELITIPLLNEPSWVWEKCEMIRRPKAIRLRGRERLKVRWRYLKDDRVLFSPLSKDKIMQRR